MIAIEMGRDTNRLCSDPWRHVESRCHSEIRNSAVDPAGNAQGGDDQAKGRQER